MDISKRILNCKSSKNIQKDWGIEKAVKLGYLPKKINLPESVDLRADWWVVGNQGTTGSCVGWAFGSSLLKYHFTKARKLKKEEEISVRYIWMASKEMDEYTEYPSTFIEDAGTSLKAALKVAKKIGVVKAAHLPFKGKMLTLKEENFLKVAGKMKIKAFFNLVKNPKDKLSMLKAWLHYHGPVVTFVVLDSSWKTARKTGMLEKYDSKNTYGGHAISIVGYTPTHFIIRNSWGPRWGKRGHAFASYAYINRIIKEAYGIVV
jgi:C1A family cysteine protease